MHSLHVTEPITEAPANPVAEIAVQVRPRGDGFDGAASCRGRRCGDARAGVPPRRHRGAWQPVVWEGEVAVLSVSAFEERRILWTILPTPSPTHTRIPSPGGRMCSYLKRRTRQPRARMESWSRSRDGPAAPSRANSRRTAGLVDIHSACIGAEKFSESGSPRGTRGDPLRGAIGWSAAIHSNCGCLITCVTPHHLKAPPQRHPVDHVVLLRRALPPLPAADAVHQPPLRARCQGA